MAPARCPGAGGLLPSPPQTPAPLACVACVQEVLIPAAALPALWAAGALHTIFAAPEMEDMPQPLCAFPRLLPLMRVEEESD